MTIPRWVIPVLVVVFMFGGYGLRLAFTQPTTNVVFAEQTASGEMAKIEATVQGVKCKGTAGFFTKMYNETPGIYTIKTYASEHKAVFTYDPSVTSPDDIKAVMEKKLTFGDGSKRQIFTCLEMVEK
ncbi:heavy-metal-associated domain-containing protein [bacterium]|nr:heavy-metal-associated domain-containing protein [bacterium]